MLKNVLTTITTYREARGWSEYQLAEYSGLPQSTISSWYRKNLIPTLPSLQKICDAFGITLSQLLADDDFNITLTDSQKRLLISWSKLSKEQQWAIIRLIETM